MHHTACPSDTEMVVVANGDSLYDSRFVAEVQQAAAGGADIVAFDYYSRFQRPTGKQRVQQSGRQVYPPPDV